MKKIFVILLVIAVLITACTPQNQLVPTATTSVTVTTSVKTVSSTPVPTVQPKKIATTKATVTAQNTIKTPEVDTSSTNSAQIMLNGSTITVEGTGAQVSGSTVTITTAGTYTITGTLSNGQIAVDAKDDDDVKLVLNGVNISNASTSAINILNADKTVIILPENSKNIISDGTAYTFKDSTVDEPNAAIFSKDDLTISGSGSLTVAGNYNDGIASKDDLNLNGGTLTITAADDGIRGKNSIEVKGGSITVKAQGDGLKSDNAEDAEKGNVTIEQGTLNITAGGNAIQAETNITILDGNLTLTAGGGSGTRMNADTSAKGLMAVQNVTIQGGTFNINASDDAINSNKTVLINNGTFNISTGDDGIHANDLIEINGGEFKIMKSYEGIESAIIRINNGSIHVVSTDDGINVAGGKDASGVTPAGRPGMRQDTFNTSSNYFLYINGGYIYVDALGDGIDINGSVEMTNGILIVNGPIMNNNGALDYDRGFSMKGGWLVAAGSSGMAQTPDSTSSQNAFLINLTSAQKAATLFTIQDSKGTPILTFSPVRQFQSVAFSSPLLVKGNSYDVVLGGNSTGKSTNGVYEGGSTSSGSKYTNFTISNIVTQIGSSRMR